MFKFNQIKIGILTATFLTAGVLPAHVFAEIQANKGSEDVKRLADVVVTAQYKQQNIQDVPSAITAVSGKDIAAKGQTFIGDVLTFAPNAKAQNTDGDSRPRWYIRGLGTGDVAASTVYPVGIYADGVYSNSPVAGGGDLFDLERIEVLRGPQGTLYGKNTTAGAVNFISRKPNFNDQPNGYVTFGLGEYNLHTFEGAANTKLSENVAIRGAFYSEDRDGFAENLATGKSYGDVDKKSYRLQILAKLTDNTDALLKLHSRTYNGNGSNGSLAVGKYWGIYDAPDSRDANVDLNESGKIDNDGASLTLNSKIGDLNFTSISAIDQTKQLSFTDGDSTPYDVSRSYANNEWKQFTQEIRLASDASKPFSWIAGAHYFDEDLDANGVSARVNKLQPNGISNQIASNPAFRQTTVDQSNQSFALFGNSTYRFTDAFSLTGGLRWTWEKKDLALNLLQYQTADTSSGAWWTKEGYNNISYVTASGANGTENRKKTWKEFTYDITPEYQISEDVKTYFKYAHGFRSGGFNTGISGSLSQLSTVDPEYLDSYELGIKSQLLDGNLIANANVFYYDYQDIQTNLLVNVQGEGGGVTSILTNGPKAEVKGAELELDYLATDNLRLRLAAAYLDSEYTDFVDRNPVTGAVSANNTGNSLVRSPKYTLGIGGSYTFNLDDGARIVLGTDASYRDREYFLVNRQNHTVDPYLSQKAYTLWNANIGYQSANNKYQINGYVKNLLDEEYQTHGRPNGAVGQYVRTFGAPRQIGASVTVKF